MKRALCLAALLFAFTLAIPSPSAACYDSCTGTPGTCRTCETGFDVTYQVCLQTAPCRCITYAVPSYQCTGLNAASNGAAPIFLEPAAKETPARPAATADLSFLAPAP
jgi:hypothetical protein